LYEKALSSLKSTAGNPISSEQNKRKEMDAKIRLKALGNQTQGQQPTVPEMMPAGSGISLPSLQPISSQVKPHMISKASNAQQNTSGGEASLLKSAPSKKHPADQKHGNSDYSSSKYKANKALPSFLPISALKPSSKSSAKVNGLAASGGKHFTVQSPPLSPGSPLDSYEISDNEEDSDSEDERSSKPQKRIPNWAQKAALGKALSFQFSAGRSVFDPDEIFGEVTTCDLEQVFQRTKHRYKKRTSSGLWTNDRLTEAEKHEYKQYYHGNAVH
jgi:Inner centromere protein, ARK binding region